MRVHLQLKGEIEELEAAREALSALKLNATFLEGDVALPPSVPSDIVIQFVLTPSPLHAVVLRPANQDGWQPIIPSNPNIVNRDARVAVLVRKLIEKTNGLQ